MTRLRILAVIGALLGLASPAMAQSGCGGQFGALKFCGSIAGGLPGPVLIPPGGTTPINGGTVLGNPTTGPAVPIATPNPVLGIPGSVQGTLGFAGLTSGTVTLAPQSVAGSVALLLPNTSGTVAANASTPLVLSLTTGTLTCPTCVTSSGGGAITGSAPIAVSAAGVVSINAPYTTLTANNGGIVYSGATNLAILAGTATARQMLQSGASTTPAWSTATWPATTTINQILYSSAANTVAGLATVNGGLLNAGATGVPALTVTPVLGVPGASTGTMGFAGATSGTATVTAQATAGTPTLTLPNASGTFAVSASGPLALSATTGALTCSTCVTGTSGALTAGTTPTSGYTNTQILSSTGSVLSAYSVSGTGNVVLTASPSISALTVTSSFTATGLVTNADLANSTISGVALGGTLAQLNFGTHLAVGGSFYNGSSVYNMSSDATSANTVSTIVARDGSGNFTAGAITAALTGHASLDLALTGGTMSGAIAMGTNAITGLTTLASAGAMTFQSNGSTFAGDITTGQQWYLGTTLAAPQTGPILTVSKNAAALPALGTPGGVTGTAQNVLTVAAADGNNTDIEVMAFGTTASGGIRYFSSGGTAASPTATTGSQAIGVNFAYGYTGSAYVSGAGFVMQPLQTFSGTVSGTRLDFYATALNTTGIVNSASVGAGFMVGTTTDPGAGSLQLNAQEFAPNITTSSAAQTGTLCWTTGTGKFTVDTTVGCLTSIMGAKNITEHLTPDKALDITLRLDPFAFRYKRGYGDSGQYEQFGFGAEEVATVDERLVGRDPQGTLQGVRYQEMTAVLAGAIQKLKADNANLQNEIEKIRKAK